MKLVISALIASTILVLEQIETKVDLSLQRQIKVPRELQYDSSCTTAPVYDSADGSYYDECSNYYMSGEDAKTAAAIMGWSFLFICILSLAITICCIAICCGCSCIEKACGCWPCWQW